eukprot:CAMPEP_0196570936 /NCGR_PEP_ID=MMETSP1081-20130531/1096_1 /TAXON_ID=36882 /ORGANISM="Pyramimonas amylifera, Strain CCMP720" /LENGTH=167 /DNA_ID=CAMNT_0041887639 /DNA_START=149 /DNA_END=649 /DNA_ORIENTATION=-
MTEAQIASLDHSHALKTVKLSWQKLESQREKLPSTFYVKLWELEPRTKALFAKIPIKGQGLKLISLFDMVVYGLEDVETMKSKLANIAKTHAAVGVEQYMFQPFEEAFYYTLKTLLGTDFTHKEKAAWKYVLDHLVMIAKAGLDEEKTVLDEMNSTHIVQTSSNRGW